MSQRIVITGAARGLGLELARAHVALGHDVVGGCRTPATAEALKATGAQVLALDVADESSIATFARSVGHDRIDVLYNNAGVDGRSFPTASTNRSVMELEPDNFMAQIRVNAVGPMMLVRDVRGALANGSRVVNVSSQIGSMVVSKTIGRDVGYAVSKAALNMITVKQAGALADQGVIVVAMHPGYLQTDMGGPTATMAPDDAAGQIAATVGSLTNDHNGTFIRWDGTVHPW
jgi:NAD(P)-dependent dehydrogenase (short-subunit alcohol dehydrogenase family)